MSKLLVDEISDADNTGPVTVTDGLTVQGAFTSLGIDDNATSTAMTIDSSENVFVGRTSDSFGTVGSSYRANGSISATASANEILDLNRLSTDGNIMRFFKDGSTVGSIGNSTTNLLINSTSGSGLFFGSGTLAPMLSGSLTGNSIDIGTLSYRFKDLYLSGGVNFGAAGGTGTATSNVLDDYEEGTWTPTFAGLTIGNGTVSGTYTKIGRQVTVVFGFNCGSTTSVGTLGDITGLPFASANIWIGYIKVHGVAFDSGSRWYEAVAVLGNNSNAISVPSITNYNSAISASNPMPWTTNDNLVFTATYTTT
jgi:hypothetical protein